MKSKLKVSLQALRDLSTATGTGCLKGLTMSKDFFISERFERILDYLLCLKIDFGSLTYRKLNEGTLEQRILKKLAYIAPAYKEEIKLVGTGIVGTALAPKVAVGITLAIAALIAFNLFYNPQKAVEQL